MKQIVDRVLEGWLARGWGVEGLQELGELDVDFFEFPDCMVQLVETVEAINQWLVFVALVHHLIGVIVIVINKRRHEACGTGVHEGIGGQVLEFKVKGIPFLKKGGGWCRVLFLFLADEVVVIVIEWVINGSGVGFLKITGRDFT